MNHCMNKDFILVLVYIKAYENYDVINTIDIIFPRNIFVNKKLTCKEIHFKIFEYLKQFVFIILKNIYLLNFEELFYLKDNYDNLFYYK